MEFGLLGASTVDDLDKLNEFSEQEMVVIEGLMETKRSVPLIRSAFSFSLEPAGAASGNSGECVMTYSGHTRTVRGVCALTPSSLCLVLGIIL